ncbi:MAG TPA: chemotaxis protein CheB [Pinirhizobacter sp.]|uniref:chemotaxis protein CheB n=1 Tax=Pinirhizobacter sp. TaxID=2950432 RepID=UPI002CAA7A4E|nr:chemotaxis protein CheB [Pinirhizobacter sp.]HMH69223.1 chemotaxis protein CheB [Pinirhizobacter sp.]
MADRGVAVALLFGDEELGAQLRAALVELGARIVHEGAVASFGAEEIKATGADIVVVNLDDDADEELDHLYDAIDGDHPRLMFNDAAASRGLQGWDRARWARHLAAKLLEGTDIDPPRPADARGIELPEPQAPAVHADTAHAEVPPLAETEAKSEELEAELEALLSQDDESAPFQGMALGDDDDLDPGVIDVELDEAAVSEYEDLEATSASPLVFNEDLAADLETELPAGDDYVFGDAGPMAPRPAARDEALSFSAEFGELANLATDTEAEPDYLFGAADNSGNSAPVADYVFDAHDDGNGDDTAPAPVATVSHEDFAGLSLMDDEEDFGEAPANNVAAASTTSPDTSRFSLAPMVDAETASVQPPPDEDIVLPEIESRATEIAQPIPPDWSLVDDEEPAAGEAAPAPVSNQEPNPFGIEKMSAEEFLAPESDDGDDNLLEPGLGLELVSMEEAVAPRASDSEYFAETFLDSAAASVRRVLALVVAQDSEDAARLFLASVPSRLPALVLVLQQGDAAVFARGLAATTTLPSRVAEADRFAAQSSVLVLPPGHRLALRRDGQVSLTHDDVGGVDATLTQLAATFGADLTTVVFVGSGRDGVAGCQAVADRGGRVWVEEPGDRASATIAGIHAERIESFTGSVAAMAARLIEEFP